MCQLANRGVEILRLDAAPFIWKRLGTDCENQPEVHDLLVAFRALLAVVAPAVVLKAEAIVPPEPLVRYLGAGDPERVECELAYHNQLMVMLWSSLATGEARLMGNALARMGEIPAHAAWVTYVRCHDDIGWAVTDEDAASVGWGGAAHRAFLNEFYRGAFPFSFARGALFQHNEATGDARISGSAASLCGVESALERDDPAALDLAMARLELLYAVAFSYGGVPLVYMGDEIALCNDHSYLGEPGTRRRQPLVAPAVDGLGRCGPPLAGRDSRGEDVPRGAAVGDRSGRAAPAPWRRDDRHRSRRSRGSSSASGASIAASCRSGWWPTSPIGRSRCPGRNCPRGRSTRTGWPSPAMALSLDGAGVLLPAYGYVWLTV